MESEAELVEEPSRSLPCNVLEPEKDFILKFETLPELWDNTNPEYANRYKRNENLAKLLPILRKIKPNATLEDVKRKINTIRSNYRRELRKIIVSKRSGVGTDQVYTPKIWYFPYLHFLRKLEQVPLQQESEPTYQNQKSREITDETRSFSPVSNIVKPPLVLKQKKKNHKLLYRACRYLSEPSSQQVQLANPITLEWSNTLDSLDPIQRLYAKKAINDILFEAELGNLDRNSVKINDPASH